MMPPRRIAICVDDFGLRTAINDGALELVRAGVVSAVSCMTMRGAFVAGAARLRALPSSRADIGLHLDFSPPDIRKESSLALARFQMAAYTGRMSRAMLRREIIEQFHEFEASMDRPPDYIDGHQHVHQLPMVLDVLMEQISARYGGTRSHDTRSHDIHKPWLRSTRPAGAGLKAALIHRLGGRGLERAAQLRQLPTNARLLGVHGFTASEAVYMKRLRGWLSMARDRDLLMCHPASSAVEWDALAECRVAEYRALASPEFAGLLHEQGIVVMPLSAMGGAPSSPARSQAQSRV